MSIKSWVAAKLNIETKSNPYSDSSFFGNISNNFAGIAVTPDSAIRHNDVYTCVRIKSEALGQIPILLYRQQDNIKYQITSGREFNIFTLRPNPYQTWQDFTEMYVAALELRGNFFAEIKRNKYGNVYEIVPFRYQGSVAVNMNSYGQVYYTYGTNGLKAGTEVRSFSPSSILHVKLNSLDGYKGMSPISYAAQTIGSAIAGETHAANLFTNGARPSAVLETDQSFGDDFEIVERLRTQWNDLHKGASNAGKTAILENGLTYKSIQMSAVDSQLIEQRKFSREQLSSIFRVPIHMLNAAAGMKYNTIEQNNISFFRDALMPLATKLENAINPILPNSHIIKFDQKSFIRGDRSSQVKNVKTEIAMGTMSINEGRIELGQEPIDGGDVYVIATNNATYGTWDNLDKIQQANNGNLVSTNINPDPSTATGANDNTKPAKDLAKVKKVTKVKK